MWLRVALLSLKRSGAGPGYEEVAQFLLGNTSIIDSIQNAISMVSSQELVVDSDVRFVTRGGDVLEAGGCLSEGVMRSTVTAYSSARGR